MSVRNRINVLLEKVLNHVSRILISLGFSIVNRNPSVMSMDDISLISNLDMFKTPQSRATAKQIEQKQRRAHDLWQEGLVHESIELSKEAQREIYRNYDLLNLPDYYPKIMSTFWTNMIGHFSFLGIHLEGQKRGHLPSGERQIFDAKESANQQLLDSFSKDYKITKLESTREWSELSGFLPDLERLHLVKTKEDFEHIYKLWEVIWQEKQSSNQNEPILTLDSEYLSTSERNLCELGVDLGEPFVGIHIRESETANHLRSQPVVSYIEPIKYLIQKGFKVIRLGNPSMTKIPDLSGLIDLSRHVNDKNLHAYVMAKAKFFISTTSGPGSIPMLFNVPTLHTNVTSLNKNVLLQNRGSIYLPKKIMNSNNQAMSYSQILQSPIGYSEKNVSKKSKFKVLPNSSREIIEGVKEMIKFVNTQDESISNSTDLAIIKQLREKFNPLGNGNIAASYLEINREWFLND